MGLHKGQTNNKEGRPKGAGNKDLEPIRTAFRNFVEKNLPQVQKDFEAMKNPKDRLHYIAILAEYCIPKLQRSEHLGQIDSELTIKVIYEDEST